MYKILIIAAHPDDEILGCGGFMAKYAKAGNPVKVCFLGEGITARYSSEDFQNESVKSEIQTRNKNALKALEILGVSETNISFSQRYCCRFDQIPLIDLVKEIEYHIKDFKPTHLLSHAAHDANIDHCLTHKALLSAIRPINLSFLKKVMAFEVLSSTEWNPTHPFQPNCFYDISEYIENKIKALTAYDKEMRKAPHSRSEQVVKSLASFRGAQCGVMYAEAFQLIRSLND